MPSASISGRSGSDLSQLYDMIAGSAHCVAFTGAGVSTLSGIPDFRGPKGIYSTPGAERIFDLSVFLRNPSEYYLAAKEFIYGLDSKEPSIVHSVLAEMERRGMVKAVITQNIDMLHRKAGSSRVIEVHGSPSVHSCIECGRSLSFSEVAPAARKGLVPRCPACGGAMKPRITFFGESLPEDAFRDACKEAERADLMLVLGTSLQVFPAASIPGLTLREGGRIALVNGMRTPLDEAAALRFTDLGEVFGYLNERLGI